MINKYNLNQEWYNLLCNEIESDRFNKLLQFVENESQTKTIYPPRDLIFSAFNLTPPSEVRVVLLGQDPYHGVGQSHGLAFSVLDGIKTPPSLRNILKELSADLGIPTPSTGDLTNWAKQGVLLLNASLTVEAGKAGSHQRKGWEQFTNLVIKTISDVRQNVVYLLWGNYARAKKSLIDTNRHLVLEAAHPSPLSAFVGFFGCRHFSITNQYFSKHNLPTIDWQIKANNQSLPLF